MKKLITSVLILISSYCSSQVIGIKFNNPKIFTIRPAITILSDSLTINEIIDDGTSVAVNISFFIEATPIDRKPLYLKLWEGAEYTTNKDWNKTQLKQRIKDILNP